MSAVELTDRLWEPGDTFEIDPFDTVHGQHIAFDRDRNDPLPNLFVSMLQRMGP